VLARDPHVPLLAAAHADPTSVLLVVLERRWHTMMLVLVKHSIDEDCMGLPDLHDLSLHSILHSQKARAEVVLLRAEKTATRSRPGLGGSVGRRQKIVDL
jgi:hypothetical protein